MTRGQGATARDLVLGAGDPSPIPCSGWRDTPQRRTVAAAEPNPAAARRAAAR